MAVAAAVALRAPTCCAPGGCVPSRRRIARSTLRPVRVSRLFLGEGWGSPCSRATGSGGCAGTTRMVANNAATTSTFSNTNSKTASVNRLPRRPEGSWKICRSAMIGCYFGIDRCSNDVWFTSISRNYPSQNCCRGRQGDDECWHCDRFRSQLGPSRGVFAANENGRDRPRGNRPEIITHSNRDPEHEIAESVKEARTGECDDDGGGLQEHSTYDGGECDADPENGPADRGFRTVVGKCGDRRNDRVRPDRISPGILHRLGPGREYRAVGHKEFGRQVEMSKPMLRIGQRMSDYGAQPDLRGVEVVFILCVLESLEAEWARHFRPG